MRHVRGARPACPPTITVLVYVPSQFEPRSFTWLKTVRVGSPKRVDNGVMAEEAAGAAPCGWSGHSGPFRLGGWRECGEGGLHPGMRQVSSLGKPDADKIACAAATRGPLKSRERLWRVSTPSAGSLH